MNDQDPLPEPLIDKDYEITLIPAKFPRGKGYVPYKNVDIGYCLSEMTKLYIKRKKSYTNLNSQGKKVEMEYWVLYRVASKPHWLSASGNWSFNAVTVDSEITGKNSKDPVTERIYLNHKNISNFLFDNRTILAYIEIGRGRLFLQRLKEKRAEQLRLEEEERKEIEAIARYLKEKETAKLKRTTIQLSHEDFVRAHTPKINPKYLRHGEDECS